MPEQPEYPEPTVTVHDSTTVYVGGGASYALEPSLTDFLLARIGDDEAEISEIAAGFMYPTAVAKRLRAECEAKRRIVEQHPVYDEYRNDCMEDGYPTPCPTLRFLAAVYADHEAYRDEWRPAQ